MKYAREKKPSEVKRRKHVISINAIENEKKKPDAPNRSEWKLDGRKEKEKNKHLGKVLLLMSKGVRREDEM